MSANKQLPPPRRVFLRRIGNASGAALALPALLGGAVLPASPASAASTPKANETTHSAYLSLGPDEGACVEALVNVMCPQDALTPSGADCGLHLYIDRQLAGAWGRGDRLYAQGPWQPGKPQQGYQSPLTPEQYVKAGIAALRRVVVARTGRAVDALEPARLDALLLDLAGARLDADARHPLSSWFNDAFYPLFVQACFADPMYGGNRDKAHWRAIGYPGLPAFHGRDVVQFRGRAFPGAATPKSIEDFS